MPPRQSVPRIRVDLLDRSPCNLSPSISLDIRDILCRVRPLPNLLAEDFAFDDADDALYLEDGYLQDLPPFPKGCRPPLFALNSHRTWLPFPIRSEAFELGDFLWEEEDTRPLLTAPTIPRMKLMIKEQLYVQKWVETLISDSPPKHIPWTCERPATERKWMAEGSIFPAATAKSANGQHEAIKGYLRLTDTNRLSAAAGQVSYPRGSCKPSEASVPIRASTEPPTSASHVPIKSADVNPGIFRGELKASQTPHRIIQASPGASPPALLLSGSQVRTTGTRAKAPLAARRGKSLSALKLKGNLIEQLEYPDIPTAFLGSPGVWSPQLDTFPVPSYTDHQSMLLNLKSKCAALGDGVPTYVQEPLHLQTEMTHTSLSVDEWVFTRGLATFDDLLGSNDSQVPREIISDISIFLPDDSSTPAKGSSFTAHHGFLPRPHSASVLQLPVSRSSDPPRGPLPPRPALISPSTPPSVRGILKKVKSVRFEDTIIKASKNHAPPPSSIASSDRLRTLMPNAPRPSSDSVPVKEMTMPGKSAQKSAPKSRLPPKRMKENGKRASVRPGAGKTAELSKSTISVERPCRNARAKVDKDLVGVSWAEAKPKGLSTAETDLRRGIEGTAKSRLSTPLRHIFRFR